MGDDANIIIGDETALFLYLHCKGVAQIGARPSWDNPLDSCMTSATDLGRLNTGNPLYGGEPVSILVPSAKQRRRSHKFNSRSCPAQLPDHSFYKLRDGIFIASPELVFTRMANITTETRLAEIGMNLCGRYYLNIDTGKIDGRDEYLTTPEKLSEYLEKASFRGARKARKALRWVLPNSGSPLETKMALQFCNPLWRGGFALPFTYMNWDISAGRLARLAEQNEYCIDLANPELFEGLEYDGEDSHPDAGKDKRRRNALQAFGWSTFAIDKTVLLDPNATKKAGLQIAKHMGIRLQFPASWNRAYAELRKELMLPV